MKNTTDSLWTTNARTWEVALPAEEVIVALHGARGAAALAMRRENGLCTRLDEQEFFIDVERNAIVLWKRPAASLFVSDSKWGFMRPYPDVLHLELQSTSRGTRVVGTYRWHPATQGYAILYAMLYLMGGINFCVFSAVSGDVPPWPFLIAFPIALLIAAAVPTLTVWAQRASRTSLLMAAHGQLAPHELAAATSPFR